MNCDDITSILDSHETASLDALRRGAVAAHLETCCECRGAWRVASALRAERWPSAPAGLLSRIAAELDAGDDAAHGAARRRSEACAAPRWGSGALLAASVAIAAGTGVWLLADRPAPENELRVDAAAARPAEQRTDDEGGAPSDAFEMGRDYRLVASALPPTAASSGLGAPDASALAGATPIRVEVVQFFMYGCRPCYAFAPQVDGWETKAEHIELLHVPVVFNPTAELHARAFYTAEAFGKLDELHAAFFEEIHARGNRLDSAASIGGLFARFGVDEAAFGRVYRSAEIDAKVDAAIELARAFGVSATPSLVVGRRYLTSPAMTESYDRTFAVVDALAKSIYEVRRNDRCTPDAVAAHSRRLEEFRVDDSTAERRRAEADEPLTTQELLDFVASGCPSGRVF